MEKILNKCPICGGNLEYCALMQYSNIYGIKKNGELTKNKLRKEDVGSMECGYLSCTNDECDFATDCDFVSVNHKNIVIWQNGTKLYYKDNNLN